MKKFLKIVIMIFGMMTLCNNIWADSVIKEGKTFIQTQEEKGEKARTETGYTYKDKKNVEYPIYISKNGRCYIVKTSQKTGNPYNQYLGEEISKEICKELNIEYVTK